MKNKIKKLNWETSRNSSTIFGAFKEIVPLEIVNSICSTQFFDFIKLKKILF